LFQIIPPHRSARAAQNSAPIRTDAARMDITFRCLPRFEAVLPRPVPAKFGLPDWFKVMPKKTPSPMRKTDVQTVKQCPPFVDAMTCGFLMPLATDVIVKEGKLSWAHDALYGKPPIDFHENVQAVCTPFFDWNRHVVKFVNFWTIETPPGYSVLITHPINRFDLPFITVTGLVDADSYVDNFVNFPARWVDLKFNGTLKKGTPIAQCIPIKRDSWMPHFELFDDAAAHRLIDLSKAMTDEQGIYRRRFRARKR
jgi:hypothetical protein